MSTLIFLFLIILETTILMAFWSIPYGDSGPYFHEVELYLQIENFFWFLQNFLERLHFAWFPCFCSSLLYCYMVDVAKVFAPSKLASYKVCSLSAVFSGLLIFNLIHPVGMLVLNSSFFVPSRIALHAWFSLCIGFAAGSVTAKILGFYAFPFVKGVVVVCGVLDDGKSALRGVIMKVDLKGANKQLDPKVIMPKQDLTKQKNNIQILGVKY